MAPLAGHPVAALGPGRQSPYGLAQELDGRVLESVEARGKHLLAAFDSGRILHSHLRMTGAWHVYREGQPWQRSRASAWLTLSANGIVAVQFGGPVLELLDRARVALHPALRSLGPDLLDDDPQIAVAVAAGARPLARHEADRRGAARSDGGGGHRQRRALRGAVRAAHRSVGTARRPLGRDADRRSSSSRAACCRPACGPAERCRKPFTARGAAVAAARRCSAGPRVTRRARCIGAPRARLFAVSPT